MRSGRESGALHTPKRKKQKMTCAERQGKWVLKGHAHVKKEKSRKWRVRIHPQKPQTTALHTPKGKKQKMTCAERQGKWVLKGHAHVKKEKSRK